MNRGQILIDYLESYAGSRELGQILDEFHKTTVGYSFSQAVSEAREILKREPRPRTIVCRKAEQPFKNKYSIEPLLELFKNQED